MSRAAARSATPPIRTFKPRRRPLTAARAAEFDHLAPRWVLAESGEPLALSAVFGRIAPTVVEIGIGFGEALVAMADADPATDVVGVDVHTPGIAATVVEIERRHLTNVRVVHGDALDFLGRLPAGSLAGIRLFFPDPWPKARHRHRRMVAGGRLSVLVDALAPGGFIHIATDIDDYAAHARRECDADDRITGGPVDRPESRPTTRYERKGLTAGRTVTDLWYERVALSR